MNRRTVAYYLSFYRSFLPGSLLITACCAALVMRWGDSIRGVLILFKLVTDLLVIYLVSSNSPNRYYYYHNLGLSRRRLWSVTLGADFLIFLLACWGAARCYTPAPDAEAITSAVAQSFT